MEALSDDAVYIAETLAASLPAPNDNRPSNPFQSALLDPSSIDLSELVKLRFAHQTKQAASGVRTMSRKPTHAQTVLTDRHKMLRALQGVVKQQQEIGVSTGAERALRWGNSIKTSPTAGNAANAAAVATTSATAVRTFIEAQ